MSTPVAHRDLEVPDRASSTVSVEVPVAALPTVMAAIQLLQTAGAGAGTPATRGVPEGKLLLSLPEAAAALSVSVQTLRAMVQRGDIPSLHVGGTRATRVAVVDLEKYITAESARCQVWATPTPLRVRG